MLKSINENKENIPSNILHSMNEGKVKKYYCAVKRPAKNNINFGQANKFQALRGVLKAPSDENCDFFYGKWNKKMESFNKGEVIIKAVTNGEEDIKELFPDLEEIIGYDFEKEKIIKIFRNIDLASFHQAILDGNEEKVFKLLNEHKNKEKLIATSDQNGISAIHCVFANKINTKILKHLLEFDCLSELQNKYVACRIMQEMDALPELSSLLDSLPVIELFDNITISFSKDKNQQYTLINEIIILRKTKQLLEQDTYDKLKKLYPNHDSNTMHYRHRVAYLWIHKQLNNYCHNLDYREVYKMFARKLHKNNTVVAISKKAFIELVSEYFLHLEQSTQESSKEKINLFSGSQLANEALGWLLTELDKVIDKLEKLNNYKKPVSFTIKVSREDFCMWFASGCDNCCDLSNYFSKSTKMIVANGINEIRTLYQLCAIDDGIFNVIDNIENNTTSNSIARLISNFATLANASKSQNNETEILNAIVTNKQEVKMLFKYKDIEYPEPIENLIKLLESKVKDYDQIRKKIKEPLDFDINYVIEKEWEHDIDGQTRSVSGGGYEKKLPIHLAIEHLDIETMKTFLELEGIKLGVIWEYKDEKAITNCGFMGSSGSTKHENEHLQYTLIEYACYKNRLDMAKLLLEEYHQLDFTEKHLKPEHYVQMLKLKTQLERKKSIPENRIPEPKISKSENASQPLLKPIVINNNLSETTIVNQKDNGKVNDLDNTLTAEDKLKLLEEENMQLRQQNEVLKNCVEMVSKPGFLTSLIKSQNIVRSFWDKKKAKEKVNGLKNNRKRKLEAAYPEQLQKFGQKLQYEEITELTHALQHRQYHKAERIIAGKKEKEIEWRGKKFKY